MSLRARILLLVLAASLLPLLAMLWLLLENRSATVLKARDQLTERAETIARDLDDKISGTAQLLFGLARVPVVGGEDKDTCSAFLADVLKEHPQYTGLLTIRPDGKLHCDSLRTGRVLDLRDRGYFQRALTATGPVVEPVIGRLTGKGVLQIALPVRSPDGALRSILLASLNMDDYGRAVAATLPYRRMNFLVWNDGGTVIMDSPGPGASKMEIGAEERKFVLSEQTGHTGTVGAEGQARIWATAILSRAGDAGLRLALSVPEADLNEEVDGQFKRALIALSVFALVIFGVAAVLGEFAVRHQTMRLIQAISRLDAGNYGEPIGTPYPRGELGEVMAALDRMAGSLEHQRQVILNNTEALERQANFDALTGLANRHLLTDRLDQALIHGRRANRVTGVLVLDLDRFKTVNDSLGHSEGDVLLQAVASRLKDCVREGDTVARLGGDEFVVVLSDMADAADIVPVAQKILRSLSQSVELQRQLLSVSTSLGIAVGPRDGETADALLKHADTAMYRAKGQGGNAMAFFTPDMLQAITERLQVESGLRRALEQSELRLYFQPIIDASSGRVTSAEALVRWEHPQRGLILPDHFIPIAEETGLIVPIGDWVLSEACAHAVSWQGLGVGSIPVAVNLSPRQFNAASLVESVERALLVHGCPASLLQLEITESMITEQADLALQTMHRLRALGVQLSIDDFGTGYSSLSRLKSFPVSKLKIDRSFVGDIDSSASDELIVDMIVMLAKKLGLRTVAEGVETPEQLAFLDTLGCNAYQGYLFARPCTPEAFLRLVSERNRAKPDGSADGRDGDPHRKLPQVG